MSIDSLTQQERDHIEFQMQISHFAEKDSDGNLVLLILLYLISHKEDNPAQVSEAAKQVIELLNVTQSYGKTIESLYDEYRSEIEKISTKVNERT
jgi:hypothetical protein